MGEETNKIKQHIDMERAHLGRNLDEIEDRFRHATDFKEQFNKNTGWILGAAVAGGFLLSVAFGNSHRSSSPENADWRSTERDRSADSPGFVSTHLNPVAGTLDDIVTGLVAVFSDKLQGFVADTVPGFRQQYERVAQRDPKYR